jgi:hypothetical protein
VQQKSYRRTAHAACPSHCDLSTQSDCNVLSRYALLSPPADAMPATQQLAWLVTIASPRNMLGPQLLTLGHIGSTPPHTWSTIPHTVAYRVHSLPHWDISGLQFLTVWHTGSTVLTRTSWLHISSHHGILGPQFLTLWLTGSTVSHTGSTVSHTGTHWVHSFSHCDKLGPQFLTPGQTGSTVPHTVTNWVHSSSQ